MEVGGHRHVLASVPPFPPERDSLPLVQRAGWVPGPVWTGAESFSPTGLRFPERPARSESQYRLQYPGQWRACVVFCCCCHCHEMSALSQSCEGFVVIFLIGVQNAALQPHFRR
jgi:hypothetical protein